MEFAELPLDVVHEVCRHCTAQEVFALASTCCSLLDQLRPILDVKAAERFPADVCIERALLGALTIHVQKGLDLNRLDFAVDWDAFGTPTTTGSLLHLAVYCNNLEALNLLLQHGAEPNVMDTAGSTPLHTAVRYGRNAFARQLVLSGADIHARNGENVTVLHYAAKKGNVEQTRTLLKLGANPHDLDAWNNTPLHLAQTREVAMELLEADANPFALNNDGQSALEGLPVEFFLDYEVEQIFRKPEDAPIHVNYDIQWL